MRAKFHTADVRRLAADIEKAPAKSSKRLKRVLRNNAGALTLIWKRNARDTAGEHGKRYPRAIGYDLYAGGLTAVIGPDALMPQGGMSFEYGSRNQSAHLDGNRAADDVNRVFPGQVADAASLDHDL